MNTALIMFDEVQLIVPVVNSAPIEMPTNSFESFGAYCGAGDSFGLKVVPETVFGVIVSPACFIHDMCWDLAEPTWADFHQSNSIFLHNILAIIRKRSDNIIMEHVRNYRAVTYYNVVDTIGAPIFMGVKGCKLS